MEVLILKLVTGEDVVGSVDDTGESYTVVEPVRLNMAPNPDKAGSFRLVVEPWAPYAKDNTVSIFKNTVVACFAPDEHISAEYAKRGAFRPAMKPNPELLQENVQ